MADEKSKLKQRRDDDEEEEADPTGGDRPPYPGDEDNTEPGPVADD